MPRQEGPIVSNPPADVARAMSARRPGKPTGDALRTVREKIRELRDLGLQIAEQEAALSGAKRAYEKLRADELPAMLSGLGIRTLGLDAEGNMPPYDATLEPFYKANISVDWEQEKQDEAFDWLGAHGHGDLVKNTIIVELGRKEHKRAKKLTDALDKMGYEYTVRKAVPWNTLTAWLKEQIEKYKQAPPLDLFGATVGQIVKLKERKDKQ